MVARDNSSPSRAQIFSCLAKGSPSAYFRIITSATEEAVARLCFSRKGGVTVVIRFPKPVFSSHFRQAYVGVRYAGQLPAGSLTGENGWMPAFNRSRSRYVWPRIFTIWVRGSSRSSSAVARTLSLSNSPNH